MTSWVKPINGLGFMSNVSTATPLAIEKLKLAGYSLPSYWELFIGNRAGCIGETSVLLLLLGGLWLIYKNIIDWKIPVSFILTVFIVSFLVGKDPIFHILSGGLFLGAFFMATDWVTTPLTSKGRLIFGIGGRFIYYSYKILGGLS